MDMHDMHALQVEGMFEMATEIKSEFYDAELPKYVWWWGG